VRSVQVSITRAVPGGCRFVRADGRLSRVAPCSTRFGLVAKGTDRWSVRLGRRLAAGRYRVTVRALDGSGNVRTVRRTVRI
jgi:hypothetical protein